jgi:MoxR-like ATPase
MLEEWPQPAAGSGDTVDRDDANAPVDHTEVGRLWERLRDAVALAVIDAERPTRLLAIALLADGHALIEDVPGVGKTVLAKAFSRALGLDFARVQGTPDLLPGDVTGSSVLQGGEFRFVPGPIFTNVLLVDEINRATPRTQSGLLEAMQERQVSVDGRTRPLPDPFLVLATENPIELEGPRAARAQLDRFSCGSASAIPARASGRSPAVRLRAEPTRSRSSPTRTRSAQLASRQDGARDRGRRALPRRDLPRDPDPSRLRLGASPRAASRSRAARHGPHSRSRLRPSRRCRCRRPAGAGAPAATTSTASRGRGREVVSSTSSSPSRSRSRPAHEPAHDGGFALAVGGSSWGPGSSSSGPSPSSSAGSADHGNDRTTVASRTSGAWARPDGGR